VTAAYADLFESRGGTIKAGNALTLREASGRWEIDLDGGPERASEAVIALGPWSPDTPRRLGYHFPMAIKRGYHMHYKIAEGANLTRPVLDATNSYVLAPMIRGIRLTTAVEIAPRDAKPSPLQLERAEKHARQVLPLGERVEAEPRMGFRPVFADMRPLIGGAPRHANLWLAFGHGHHGFSMGPVTGRLMSEIMTGRQPSIDVAPFSPARFPSVT
jgi:D-amino-acid dehydrogenase